MTPEAIKEREAVVKWLRGGGFANGWRVANLKTRLKAAWIGFKAPWAFAQASSRMAAEFIERGDHMEQNT